MSALAPQTRLACIDGLPLIGNASNGSIAGLTPESYSACIAAIRGELTIADLAQTDPNLPKFIEAAGLLEKSTALHIATAYLHITQHCNMKCAGCYSSGTLRNTTEDPSLDNLFTALDFLEKLTAKRLVLSGGEPFFRDDLREIAIAAHKRNIEVVDIITNGSMLNPKTLRSLSGLVNTVGVSYSGDESQGADALDRSLTENQLRNAICLIQDANLTPQMLVTLHSRNVAQMRSFLDLGNNLGVPVRFSMFTCVTDNSDLKHLEIPEHFLDNVLEVILEDQSCRFGDEENAFGLSFKDSCGVGHSVTSIDADGTVYPCHMMHEQRHAVGNAFSDPVEQLIQKWRNNPFYKLNAKLINSCHSCEYRTICGGGCRVRAFTSTDDFLALDPHCALSFGYYRSLISYVKNIYGLE